MKPIQMVDLFNQYSKIKDEIDTAMQDVIQSSVFIKGGKVNDFEQKLSEYLSTNVIACGNGTDALQICFMALGLKPGDEVITTPFTFIATVEVLALLNLKPIFVDVEAGNFNIDVSQIEKAITPKTKAILPVHLYGQNANMEEILRIAKAYNLYVIEDAAQSLGANYYFKNKEIGISGTMGTLGTTSFFPSKVLGAFGDGGAVFCNNEQLAKKIRSIANHGMSKKYNYERIGLNSRLDNLQAAVLEVKLKYLNQFVGKRQWAAKEYDKRLLNITGIQIPERNSYSNHLFHQYTLCCEKRDELKNHLTANNIPSMVYYPKPLHLQNAYKYLEYQKGDFPISEELSKTVLSLPMHTELELEQIEYISMAIKSFFGSF
jgi:dTDP-4-amino-4,6-dideoxygalactose transaminase